MTSLNGFAVSASPTLIGIKSYKVPGTSVVLPVRADIAPLLIGFATEFDRLVEPLDAGSCWGYAYRPVRGGSTPSFHAAGLAIDLNAPRHPLGRAGTFTAAQATTIRRLASKYGLRWGGDYTARKDEMHVEVILPHAQALDRVRELTSPPAWYRRVLRDLGPGRYLVGPDVAHVQAIVSPPAGRDGVYGPATAKAVAAWQARHGLTADGVVGPATARKLG